MSRNSTCSRWASPIDLFMVSLSIQQTCKGPVSLKKGFSVMAEWTRRASHFFTVVAYAICEKNPCTVSVNQRWFFDIYNTLYSKALSWTISTFFFVEIRITESFSCNLFLAKWYQKQPHSFNMASQFARGRLQSLWFQLFYVFRTD